MVAEECSTRSRAWLGWEHSAVTTQQHLGAANGHRTSSEPRASQNWPAVLSAREEDDWRACALETSRRDCDETFAGALVKAIMQAPAAFAVQRDNLEQLERIFVPAVPRHFHLPTSMGREASALEDLKRHHPVPCHGRKLRRHRECNQTSPASSNHPRTFSTAYGTAPARALLDARAGLPTCPQDSGVSQ